MKRILCAVCISLLGWQALAGEVDDSLNKLNEALKNAEKQEQNSGLNANRVAPMPPMASFPTMPQRIITIRQDLARGDLNSAIQHLQAGNAILSLPEDLQKSADELLTSLCKEQEAREKAAAVPIDAAIKHATEAVKKAKSAADLDAAFEELTTVQNPNQKRDASTEKLRAAYSKLEDTYSFVASWQEYLAAKAGGYDAKAREIAKKLANASTRLLPRSELLAKAYPGDADAKAKEMPSATPAPKPEK